MARTFGCSASEALTVFSAIRSLWTLYGMVLQTAERTRTCQSSVVRDVTGVKIAGSERQYDFRDEMTATWKAAASGYVFRGAPAYFPDLHENKNGWCFDEISFSTAKGAKATATAKAHAHRLASGGALCSHQNLAATVPGAEVRPFFWFGASTFDFSLGVDAAGLQSGVYTVRFLHGDAYGLDGNWLCGKTHGAVASATFEAIDDTDWTTPSGWTRKSDGSVRGNTAYGRRTATFEKVIF